MDAHEEYAYLCIACHERLLSSTHNQWIRVGKRHLMPRTGISIREHGQLLLEEDSVVGKQELASCELQRLQCGNCKSHIGLRCKDAPSSKKRLIGRLFVRQATVEVHALITPPGSNSSSDKRVVRRIQFAVEQQQSHHLSPNALAEGSVNSTVDSASQDSDVSGKAKAIRPEQIHAILERQASLIAEVKALRQLAARNQQVLRSQLDQVSTTNPSENEHQNNRGDAVQVAASTEHSESGTDSATQAQKPKRSKLQEQSMSLDTDVDMANNDPPSRPAEHNDIPAVEMSYDTQFLAAPLDPLPDRYSDSDYEPTQPLIDQPLHQPLTRNLTRDEVNRRGARHASNDLRRNTLEDLHRSQDIPRPNAGPSRRGGALRRGFSGGRVKPSANSAKRKGPEPNTPPLRDKYGNRITSTGKIDGRSLRYKNAQAARYQSSPLAAPYSLDGTTSSGSNPSARGNGASEGDPAASSTALATRTMTSSSGDGVARSYKEIMKYVNKGMKAQMAKSRLERGYSRLPKPN